MFQKTCTIRSATHTHTHTHTHKNPRRKIAHSKDEKVGLKSQSAMEYLMTYGWAILIIAIVLVAFFSLNLFNPYTFSPKASPGSCQILRPNGPGSNLFVSAVGPTCTTNEIPQYTATFSQSPAGYITASIAGSPGQVTVSFWIDPINNGLWGNSGNYWEGAVEDGQCVGCFGINIEAYYNPPAASVHDAPVNEFSNRSLTPNTWQQITGTFNGTYIDLYFNGKLVALPVAAGSNTVTSYTEIIISGTNPTSGPGGNPISGYMANVQVYNTSLSPSAVNTLYAEGIGGAPIDLNHLVGWWPLNGNANDYSGNGNNGVPTGVTFTSSWENGYSAP